MNAYLMNRTGFYFADGQAIVIERSKRRWRVRPGDVFVLFHGFDDQLTFDLVCRVLKVDVERFQWEENGRHRTMYEHAIHVTDPIALPGNRNLSSYMFSLRRVYNLSRPRLHFRHRSPLSDEDLETVLSGRIHARRSLYYGLLRHLPAEWRQFYEHESYALAARADALRDPEESPPVDQLLALLNATVFQAVSLAASVQSAREQLGIPGIQRIVAATDDDSLPTWSPERLLRKAPQLSERINQGRRAIGELQGPRWTMIDEPVPLPEAPLEQLGESPMEDEDDESFLPGIAAQILPTERKEPKWKPHRW